MSRNAYRNWTPAEVEADALATWGRMKFNGIPVSRLIDSATGKPIPMFRLNFDAAVERLGLKLVTSDVVYQLDAEGKPIIDEKGNPVVESITKPVHDWSVNVKVEGYTDCEGVPIPKGNQYFLLTLEPGNRQLTPSNVVDIAKRLGHYVLTGEPLIKDADGSGQNEQHRECAVVLDRLTGANLAPENGIPIVTMDGVSKGAAGAIDTGKQKSAKDDLTSNHELLAPVLPLRYEDYRDGTEIGFQDAQKQERARILGEMQGACKRITLRMLGANIKASKFSGYESSGNVQAIAEHWEGLDELVNMAHVMLSVIPAKVDKKQLRPCKTWEIVTAYALYTLRQSPVLPSVEDLADYEFPEIELSDIKDFLNDLITGCVQGTGPLAEWAKDRVTDARKKDSDESSFAQVCRAMQSYFLGEAVDPELNKAMNTGKDKENSTKFFHFGGGDRGPIPRKKKGESAE